MITKPREATRITHDVATEFSPNDRSPAAIAARRREQERAAAAATAQLRAEFAAQRDSMSPAEIAKERREAQQMLRNTDLVLKQLLRSRNDVALAAGLPLATYNTNLPADS